jgi:trehalose 6-phosphate synthase/phosphatase
LVAGDDDTDEEIFKALPEAFSIKVGRGETAARYTTPSYRSLREALRLLAEVRS